MIANRFFLSYYLSKIFITFLLTMVVDHVGSMCDGSDRSVLEVDFGRTVTELG